MMYVYITNTQRIDSQFSQRKHLLQIKLNDSNDDLFIAILIPRRMKARQRITFLNGRQNAL